MRSTLSRRLSFELNRVFSRLAFLSVAAICFCSTTSIQVAAEEESVDGFEVKEEEGGITVLYDGEVYTRYLVKSGNKPIMWPLAGPEGVEMTRNYPMIDNVDTEKKDHPHHRSFWFTHGDVNGVSYWHEASDTGFINHREFVKAEGGDHAEIVTINDWVDPDGNKVCEDKRTYRYYAKGEFRWIDSEVTVTATASEVTFGDTKEGSFGVRVAGTMRQEVGLGGKIVSSEGLMDGDAWGKPARWVDYHGPVDGKTVGIAIMNHPTSYGFPSHWHVRLYGLFAANPFGLRDFYGRDSGKDGTLKLNKGDSFTLKYRVLIHPGDHEEGEVEAFYEDYVDSE